MAIKISKKIKGYSVQTPEDKSKESAAPAAAVASPSAVVELVPASNIIHMHEQIERPEVLIGSTYKIKSPLVEHAMYVTLNDIVLNPGTEHELRRPFEVFINSKNMDHFQWIVALTRIMSAVFRKGGDVTFLVDEMKAVFDPRGGYFKAGGVYMPSIVAEIGSVVEDHLKSIGMIHDPELDEHQRRLIHEKRAAYENRAKKKSDRVTAAGDITSVKASAQGAEEAVQITGGRSEPSLAATAAPTAFGLLPSDGASFPPGATLCFKCNTKATVIMDGCATCLNCGYSKCG